MSAQPNSQPRRAEDLIEAIGQLNPELVQRHREMAPVDEGRRHLKRTLAAAAGEVAEAIVLLDAMAGSEDELEGHIASATALLERLRRSPSLRAAGGPRSAMSWQSGLTDRSPISGQSNPVAPPLFIDGIDAEGLHAHAVYGYRHEGPIDSAHGGVIAGAFDEIVGVAQVIAGVAGVTGTLTVRMRRPTPLHRRIDYLAGVDHVEGRKVFVWGRSTCDGETCAETEAIMILPREGSLVPKYDWTAKADNDPGATGETA